MSKNEFKTNSELAKMIAQLQSQVADLNSRKDKNDFRRRRRDDSPPRSLPHRHGFPQQKSREQHEDDRWSNRKRTYNEPPRNSPYSRPSRQRSDDTTSKGPRFHWNHNHPHRMDHNQNRPFGMKNNRRTSVNNNNNRSTYHNTKRQNVENVEPSENKDFAQIVKLINRAATVRHHSSNWKSLPETVSTQLDEFAAGIRPPAPDKNLEEKLKSITEDYKAQIGKTVREHLMLVLYKTGEELSLLSNLDLPRAKETAVKQIKHHFKDKIIPSDVEHWTKMAADLVGTHPSLIPIAEPEEKRTKMETDEGEEATPGPQTGTNENNIPKPKRKFRKTYTSLIRKIRLMKLQKEKTLKTNEQPEGESETTIPETQTLPSSPKPEERWYRECVMELGEDDDFPSFQLPNQIEKKEEKREKTDERDHSSQPKPSKLKKNRKN